MSVKINDVFQIVVDSKEPMSLKEARALKNQLSTAIKETEELTSMGEELEKKLQLAQGKIERQ